MKKRLLIAIGLLSYIYSYPQNISIIGGESPNSYLKVDSVLSNGIRITETLPGQLSAFLPGDKVMVIQMTGVTIDDSDPDFKTILARTRGTLGSTGVFEILQVDEVVTGAETIIYFTDNITHAFDYREKIQAVRFVEGENVNISGTVTCKPWDGKVGGIMAIIGIDSIKVANNSSLDVSRKGFRGGAIPAEIYTGGCRSAGSNEVDTLYFLPSEKGRAGYKGEGIITTLWPYTMGFGFNINGGGGGNGQFSGGGGGGNGNVGGDGGQQSNACTNTIYGGLGGYGCMDLYNNNLNPKAVLGGGGGSGNRQIGVTPSRGGNGGGMIILITGTLVSGTSVTIKANGENATPITTYGSGAGGGAGGTILIDASGYQGNFIVEAKGGDGSSSLTIANGAGGSGSGGIVWHSGTTFAGTANLASGSPGTTGDFSYLYQNGGNGLMGAKLNELILPLTGFLFNSVKGIDTICQLQVPNVLNASQPKGGNGTYDYLWQQSHDHITWSNAIGTGTLKTFQPPELNQTTWYKRIITSQNPETTSPIQDESQAVQVFVYNAIANNSILGTDTICYNLDGKPVTGIPSPLTGGNGSYEYNWQTRNDQSSWTTAGTLADYDPLKLEESTWYRRIVTSSYCSDTSNAVRITVLLPITGNHFLTPDTSICENSGAGQLKMGIPAGGDGYYKFQWQSMAEDGLWSNIALTADSSNYTTGTLTDTVAFRRIVFSGNDIACIDTGNVKTIFIRPLISNNHIIGSAVQYTCFNTPALLTGSQPADGFGNYAYIWEESTDNTIWNTTPGNAIDYESLALTNVHYFRRIVYSSGTVHECTNISDAVEVRINPLPVANVIDSKDTLCAGSPLYVKFTVSGNGPFDVTVSENNTTQKFKQSIIGPVDSILFNPAETYPYTIASVIDDSLCPGDYEGFIEVSPATVYQIPVANAGNDDQVCGESYILQAVKSNPSYGGLWSPADATFADSTSANSAVIAGSYGTHAFTWTETNWLCADDDEVEITFYEMPLLPDAGPDQELDFIYTTSLQAASASAGTGVWSVTAGNGEFSDVNSPTAVVSELNNTTKLKWTVTNGNCPSVADSLVITIKPLVIKKGFTPNSDTKNDEFDFGAINAENISVKIFNSAGVLVYKSDNYLEDEKWKGYNMDGVELPEGTYYYVANIKVAGKKDEVQFRSFVEIMR